MKKIETFFTEKRGDKVFYILIALSLFVAIAIVPVLNLMGNRETRKYFDSFLEGKALYTYQNTKKWEFNNCSDKQLPIIPVAVIDTGLDLEHKRFRNRIWDKAKPMDFITNRELSGDYEAHGTHVTGILFFYPKLSNPIRVLPIANYNYKNEWKSHFKSIKYAVNSGVKIINYSGGGEEYNEDEEKLIREADKKNILFITSAGNENSNLKTKKHYPASLNLSNIISVGNINNQKKLSRYTNYGNLVSVYAEGENILSSFPGNIKGIMGGTSQSAPFVTRLAACVWANNPELTHLQVKDIIVSGKFPTKRNLATK